MERVVSFFFQKVGQAKRKVLAPNPIFNVKQQSEMLHRLGCKACPLDKVRIGTPKMGPTLAPSTEILFLAEAPGKDEDQVTHRPLTGPSGKLLRQCIPDEFRSVASFDNVVNCRPSDDNRTPVPLEIECCRPRRIKVIEEAKPRLIVGLGAIPLQMMLKTADLQGLRGRLFAVKIGSHSCYFMPTYHPSYILRISRNKEIERKIGYKLDPLKSIMGHCFRMDIERACSLVADLDAPLIETESDLRSGILTFKGGQWGDLIDLLALAKKAPIKAIDIENYPLRPYAKDAIITTCAVSFDNTHFSFAIDHPKAGWSIAEREIILDDLYDLVNDNTIKVAHNAIHECEWLIQSKYLGEDVINHKAWECTQVQAHVLDERRGAKYGRADDDENRANPYQSLDFLCKMYFGTAFKVMFKLDKKNMAKADLDETLIYNAVDTRFTLRLYHHQTRLLKDRGLYEVYKEAAIRQPVVALMQYLGVDVDQSEVKRCQGKLAVQIAEIKTQIFDLPVVKQYIADKGEFNPLGQDALAIFRDYLKRSEIQVQDGKRLRWSVDRHVLEKIDHPLAKLIVELRHLTKLKSTYSDGLELGKGESIWPDGKIHCHFNTTFTETARLSSDSPNMQNFCKRRDQWLRSQIVAPPDYHIVAADYGQLEMCCAAMFSKDTNLVKDLWEGTDTHMSWAKNLVRMNPDYEKNFSDPKVAEALRGKVKGGLVFASLYGAGIKKVSQSLGLSERKAEDLLDEFWDTFPGVRSWQDKLMKKYYEKGYVEDLTGGRRHYPLTRNEAINAPLQRLASELTVNAMCRLSVMALTENKMYLHPRLNIHDDILLVVPDDKIEESCKIICKTMLTFDFDFVNVPLSVTVSSGKNWGEMVELGKFSSRDIAR